MDNNLKRVQGHDNLYKNEETGLIVSTDRDQTDSLRDHYRLAKRHALSNIEARDDVKDLKKDVEELKEMKQEMSDIKALLLQLVNQEQT